MRIVQRALLIITVILFLTAGIAFVCKGKAEKLQQQWETIQAELFLEKLCRTGQLSLEEYNRYVSCLNRGGGSFEVTIEEHQKEQDKAGKVYYYLISWDELRQNLFYEDSLIFQQNSVVKMEIVRRSQGKKVRNYYYGIIAGKETG